MGLYTKLAQDTREVDVIIAGGGTAGCIVASRLADADPDLSVLVIEAGSTNLDKPNITYPALFINNIMPNSKTAQFFTADKSEELAGREITVPCGNVLGGGSSINFMTYTRGSRSDFEAWNMPGWTAEDMLPYLMKVETFHGKGDMKCHGSEGPIQVSRGTMQRTEIENDFIKAAGKVGLPEIDDLQDLKSVNGVQRAMRFIDQEGKRQDTAHKYLHPRLKDGKHQNLHVVVESHVVRVLFEDKRACGVVLQRNPVFHPIDNEHCAIKAKKLVVLSGGTFGTPLILERSGIGSTDVLSTAGVPVVVDLPGVGDGYEDHQLASYGYNTSLRQGDTLDDIIRGNVKFEELVSDNSSLLGYNGQDMTCKLRPTDGEVKALGPEFEAAWNVHFAPYPDKPLILLALINALPGFDTSVPASPHLGITSFSVYPFSRGDVHITGPSPGDSPSFRTGFFADSHSLDLKTHVWAYKKQREIVRRMSCYRGEVVGWHPAFSTTSAAACMQLEAPLPENVADIIYSPEDDAAIERFMRDKINTAWHSLGTCKMAPPEHAGVVDATLRVYGVEMLRIADLSVVPRNIGPNTNNMALAIGERAADFFIHELGLQRVT